MNKVTLYVRNVWNALRNNHVFTQQLIDTIDYLTEELHKAESKLIKQDKNCECVKKKALKKISKGK